MRVIRRTPPSRVGYGASVGRRRLFHTHGEETAETVEQRPSLIPISMSGFTSKSTVSGGTAPARVRCAVSACGATSAGILVVKMGGIGVELSHVPAWSQSPYPLQ